MSFAIANLLDLRAVAAWALGLLTCATALALPADVRISQLYHTRWTVQDGAPTGIESIAQTRDGYIWMSAGGRLFRFDGVEFERVERVNGTRLPAENIYSIWARPQGGLWISYIYGGATFIGEDHVESYFAREGLPPNSITDFRQDSRGGMWAGTTRGLMRLEEGTWRFAGDAWNIPQTLIGGLLLDRDGTFWVLAGSTVFYLRDGGRRFEAGLHLPPSTWMTTLLSSPDGTAWLTRAGVGLTELRTPAPGQPMTARWRKVGYEAGDDTFPIALIDRDSNLWLAASDGVARVPLSLTQDPVRNASSTGDSPLERVRLSGEYPVAMLEDREGTLWVVSNGGLDKFRWAALARVPLPAGAHGMALAMADEGTMWVSARSSGLHRFVNGVQRESLRTPISNIEALHRDSRGTLWVGAATNSVWHRRDGQWIEWRPEGLEPLGGIQAIASEPGGALWVSVVRAGVYRVVDNQWSLWGGRSDLPAEPATTLAVDPTGRLWAGYVNSRLAVIDHANVTLYDEADGLTTGAVQVTAVRGRNVWIGGERGLNWFDGRRFHTVEGTGQQSFGRVNGIVEKAHGDLWLNASEGAVHIPAAEVRKFVADPRRTVQFRVLDYLDGMPGAPNTVRPVPTAAESSDGRIWFVTTNGLVSLAPERLATNPVVPNVFVKSITVDGHRYEVDATGHSPIQLPTNPRNLQIAYTALSFAIPERVNFKYRLEGTNMGWQAVGMRRDAYFTELPPGRYRFQVLASNDSGVWNETGATVEFVIPPTFLQSRGFIVLCVASASAALWLLFLLRMRHLKAQLQWRGEERLLERERIARELHDTFLQGVHGLMLRFQTATERIPVDEPARQLMEDALERADRVLAEGRDKVSDLRASMQMNLPESLRMAGNDLSRDYAVPFESHLEGTPHPLNPLVQEETFRIVTEAMTNAFRHAQATRISTFVHFGRRSFSIRVIDDGRGFDVFSGSKPSRWGLKGMQERAEKIRGRVIVSSKPGAGTAVELHVPARLAYKKQTESRWRWLSRLGRKTEDAT